MRFGNNTVFRRAEEYACSNPATMKGVAHKSAIMLLTALASAALSILLMGSFTSAIGGIVIVGYMLSPILTLVLSLIMSFNPLAAKVLAIPYSILEGISIGSICGLLFLVLGIEGALICALALVITLSFFLGATLLYSTGLVKVTTRLRRFAFIALFGIVISSLIVAILSIFNPAMGALFYGGSNLGIIVSVISILIAGIYTLITLDNAKRIVDAGLDEQFEWYAAFGIVLNVIWLFWEVLSLLLKILARTDR